MDKLTATDSSAPTPLVQETSEVSWVGVIGLLLATVAILILARWLILRMGWSMPRRSRLIIVGFAVALAIALIALPL